MHGFFSFQPIVRVEERLWFLTPSIAGARGTGKTRGAGELVIAARVGLEPNLGATPLEGMGEGKMLRSTCECMKCVLTFGPNQVKCSPPRIIPTLELFSCYMFSPSYFKVSSFVIFVTKKNIFLSLYAFLCFFYWNQSPLGAWFLKPWAFISFTIIHWDGPITNRQSEARKVEPGIETGCGSETSELCSSALGFKLTWMIPVPYLAQPASHLLQLIPLLLPLSVSLLFFCYRSDFQPL